MADGKRDVTSFPASRSLAITGTLSGPIIKGRSRRAVLRDHEKYRLISFPCCTT
ncbi:hypothetical protein RVN83_20670 [Streptomyces sp. PU10]|uniref:hypothetical protein n=1 Tax=Streptomyces TaxID=1883 RepID=UPI00142F56E7|nr:MULTISPECIES: hypothetical protein [Streptomyces]MBH5129676.1 hypothetical protein [Streptomyces sp. HB-N217]MDU0255503.1 hypothetical protein [Streptomyces sp. PU10]WSU02055.1 hypothetical protein OG368_16155 [Streptomyces sp. NBC_01124]